MKREPLLAINVTVGIIEAGIALALPFGLRLNAEQTGAVMALVIAIGTIVATVLARSRVTPVSDPRDAAGRPLRPT